MVIYVTATYVIILRGILTMDAEGNDGVIDLESNKENGKPWIIEQEVAEEMFIKMWW